MKSYRCLVCGHIHVGLNPPRSCPVCGVSSDDFENYEDHIPEAKSGTMAWSCLNCEYVHEGSNAPAYCPVCGANADMFEPYHKPKNNLMNSENTKFVIVGSGIAGVSCAEEIRNHCNKAKITIVSQDTELPYYRLNLTRYLAKEINRENLYIYPKVWYDDNHINLITDKKVHNINKEDKQLQMEDRTIISYDKLILANGSHPFVPPIPGNDLKNVITVRNLEDGDFLIEKMKTVKSCICIGGGILGLEVAGAIGMSGIKVTLLEGSQWLMPRQLNSKAAALLKTHLSNIGVEVMEKANTKRILGQEECEGVELSTGEILQTKLVIITTGVRPNIYLAKKSGLEVNMGVIVDSHMKTSDEDIYAAGDVTEHYGVVYGLWNVAQFQGKTAAQNALGIPVELGSIPRSNVLKILGLDMFSIGEISPGDGSYYQYEKEASNSYVTFILRDGKILGSIIIGNKALSLKVKQAIETGLNFPHEIYDNVDSIIDRFMN